MNIQLQTALNLDDLKEFNIETARQYKMLRLSGRSQMVSPRQIRQMRVSAVILLPVVGCFEWAQQVHIEGGKPADTLRNLSEAFIMNLLPNLIVAVFVWWLLSPGGLLMRFQARIIRFRPSDLETKTIQVTDAAIMVHSPGSRRTYQWDHFFKFFETNRLFCIFLDPAEALMLPKRAFPSPASLNEFRAFAQANIGKPIIPVQPPVASEISPK